MRALIFILWFVGCLSARAGSWGIILKKQGSGSGQVCFVESQKTKNCHQDESDQELNFVLDGVASIFAEPAKDSKFVKWSGDCAGSGSICQLKVQKPVGGDRPLEAIAIFNKKNQPSAKVKNQKPKVRKNK